MAQPTRRKTKSAWLRGERRGSCRSPCAGRLAQTSRGQRPLGGRAGSRGDCRKRGLRGQHDCWYESVRINEQNGASSRHGSLCAGMIEQSGPITLSLAPGSTFRMLRQAFVGDRDCEQLSLWRWHRHSFSLSTCLPSARSPVVRVFVGHRYPVLRPQYAARPVTPNGLPGSEGNRVQQAQALVDENVAPIALCVRSQRVESALAAKRNSRFLFGGRA